MFIAINLIFFVLINVFTIEETRRSARATKGQNSKTDSIDQNLSTKKKGKKVKKIREVQEEPAEIIRCVCGAIETGDNDQDPWIACDSCDAWQHNICMGISSYGEDVPDQYFCEKCHPQDHQELLLSIKKGEKLWEVRRRVYEKEQAEALIEESSAKKRGRRKSKKINDLNSNNLTNGKVVSTAQVPIETKTIQKTNSVKRKNRESSNDNDTSKVCKIIIPVKITKTILRKFSIKFANYPQPKHLVKIHHSSAYQ